MPSEDHRYHHHGGSPPPKPNQKVLSMILKFIIMTAITTLFFFFLGVAAVLLLLATASLHRHSDHHPSSNSSDGLSLKDLKKLPQFRFSRKLMKPENEVIDCVVCLEGFKQGQWCRKLAGCGHVFHRKCVDTWLIKVSACPICRTKVLLEDRPLWGFRHMMNS